MRKVSAQKKEIMSQPASLWNRLTLTLTVGTANGLKAIFAPDYFNTQPKRNEVCTLQHYFHSWLCRYERKGV